mgnify:FL=1
MRKYIISLVAMLILFVSVNVYAADISELTKLIDASDGKVVLEDDYEGNPTGIRKKVTIDLNGHKINAILGIIDDVTLIDSKGTGEITSDNASGATVQVVDNGILTVDGATIKNPVGYGIAGYDNSKITIKSGKIESYYSAISGNNTEGTLDVTVNGGVFTAKEGPAIYMPSPVGCKITDGIFYGGISVRMGIINISGGKFIANPVVNDIKTNYMKQNIATGDALFVLAGSYTSNHKNGNKLDLNITGGEFITENKAGSAIVIYDLGKVKQDVTIKLDGSLVAKTNASDRGAFDILTLSDLGVENIDSAYNNKDLVGLADVTVTGGSYSTSVGHFLSSDYVMGQKDGMYVVASRSLTIEVPTVDKKADVKEVTVGVASNDGLKSILEKSLEDSKIDTSAISPQVVIESTNLDKNNIDDVILNGINKALSDKSKDIVLSDLFDISVVVKDSINNKKVTLLTDLSEELEFNILVPKALLEVKEGVTRTFYIVRYHEGKAEFLDIVNNDGVLSFKSDKFSAYAIAYEDKKNTSAGEVTGETEVKNPATIDGIGLALFAGVFSFVALAGTGYILVKKHN